MIRRSWRDLQAGQSSADDNQQPEQEEASADSEQQSLRANNSGDLNEAAALVPGSRLDELLQQRQQLEAHIASISGNPNGRSNERDDARFQVLSFAERQQQERDWLRRHEANNARARSGITQTNHFPFSNSLGPTPLEAQMNAGLPERSSIGTSPSSASQRIVDPRSALQRRFSRRPEMARRAQTPTDSADGLRAMSQVRDFGRNLGEQSQSMSRKMRDLDNQLAENDVSQADRDEIRNLMKGDQIDKVSSGLDKANKSLDAPKKLVSGIDNKWKEKEQLLTGAMDKVGPYAQIRDRRLSSETGGSGDLFERMKQNRKRALERRRQQQLTERRDEQRRKRAQQRRAEKAEQEKRGRV